MGQFDSELEANRSRAMFQTLSQGPLGLHAIRRLIVFVLQLIASPESSGLTGLSEAVNDVVECVQKDRELRDTEELRYLVNSVALTVERHERGFAALKEQVGSVESRIEAGIRAAARYPNDGRTETIDRLAIVIVRGAIDFPSNPQEQTTEFLRIASSITDTEMALLRIIYETQADLKPPGPTQSREEWLHAIQQRWARMNSTHPKDSAGWMHRKSACVRLQSHGFLEQTERNKTGVGSETGQAPYALLPLGREFWEYSRPMSR